MSLTETDITAELILRAFEVTGRVLRERAVQPRSLPISAPHLRTQNRKREPDLMLERDTALPAMAQSSERAAVAG